MRGRLQVLLTATMLGVPASVSASDGDAWAQVRLLKPGEPIWVSTSETPLTELYYAAIEGEALRVALVAPTDASRAPREKIAELCAGPPDRRLVVSGEELDFTELCRLFPRERIVEIKTRRRSPAWRATAIGAGIGGGAALIPCGVAPQADGSTGACVFSGAALGAFVGWAVHSIRRGEIVTIYKEPRGRGEHRCGSLEARPRADGDHIVSPPFTP